MRAVNARQHSLHVVLENIHDKHNVSAIYRSCDAVGIPKISLLYTFEKLPKISNKTSGSARKWIETVKFKDVNSCCESLRADGFKIYSTMLTDNAISIYDFDFTQKVAVILGNEHRGVSEEADEAADGRLFVPMRGMVQSLNVSVAAAVILYEAQRQRTLKGFYDKDAEENSIKMIEEWSQK